MKVLVADKFEKAGLDGLNDLGCEVVYEPDLKDEALGSRIRESQCDILVVRSTKVTEPMMEGAKLSLIIRAGAGYNTIDVAAASARGIYVSNCPGKNAQAVAELAFGLMIAADRHIPDNVIQLRAGKWNKKEFSKSRGLYGRNLGLLGMGRIGQEMVTRAKAFGMNVVCYSRWMTQDVAAMMGVVMVETPEELAAQSDFFSVHVSLTPDTRQIVGDKVFRSMKPGTVFVNTSRGEVVDQAAMLKAMSEGGVFCALDVFDDEPAGAEGTYDGPLKDTPNAYVTHHIGASTDQAQDAIAKETVRIVREYVSTGVVPNVVNVKKADISSHLLVVRHLDRVGVLASVLGVLKDEGVNVQEVENIILSGHQAAIAQIACDKEPTGGAIIKLRSIEHVLGVSVYPMKR